MEREKLKEILEKKEGNYVKYYRQYPTLHCDLTLWDDYLQLVACNRRQKIRAPKTRARIRICEDYRIAEKTFYAIRNRLKGLCEDVL